MAVYRQDIIKNSLGQPESDAEAAAKARMAARAAKRAHRDGQFQPDGSVTTNEHRPAGPSGATSTEMQRLQGGAYDLPAEVVARIAMQARHSAAWIIDPAARLVAIDRFIQKHVAKELK